MKVGLLVRIEAKPEYADEVAAMLGNAQQLTEQGRRTHLAGRIAAALGEAAQTKLSAPPVIASVDLLGAKVS